MKIPQELSTLLRNGGLIHVSGPAGAGKTMFAIAIASEMLQQGDVHWVAADAKIAFTSILKENVSLTSGDPSRLTLNIPTGHAEVQESIRSAANATSDMTKLIIIDPITRSLDLARDDDLMWGQPLFEEILPTLAAISGGKGIPIIITSEVRRFPSGEDVPIHWNSIRKWSDMELRLSGRPKLGPRVIEVFREEKWDSYLEMTVDETGLVQLIDNKLEVFECSESCPV